jgi:type II secretory ATPase GspE/PulE/Tfp pilus assembly ATPase PilB-like protein
MPIAGGVDVTLRVLVEGASSDGKRYLTYEQMGYTSAQSHVIRRAFNRSSGMAVVGGTTGSGKSTTLQNTIEYLIERYPTRKYRTLEDPVEYEIRGASQTSVSSSSAKGEDDVATLYNRALSAILRADPDFVMIGEIRNRSTADLAIKAATTGHQVATTLHTQSWASIYSRFANMGFSYSELAQEGIFVLLMVQRLVPILCQNCRIPFSEAVNMYKHDNEFIELRERLVRAVGEDYLDRIFLENKKGCEYCLTTSSAGIAGREVCAEVALVDEAICEAVQTGRISEIEKVWRMRRATDDLRVIDPDTMGEGWKMAEIALAKMLHGKCSPVHIEHLFCLVDDIVQYGMTVENQKGISVEAEACVRASGM